MKIDIAKSVSEVRESVSRRVHNVRESVSGTVHEVKEKMIPERIYSGMDRIPSGRASDKLIPGCLVLEGGAFRGLYTQGVLDYWMLNGLNISDVIGVSAGALSAVSYVSGQIGRSARVNIGFRYDTNYIGVGALRRAHSLINLDFLIHDYDLIEPLDMERFNDTRRRLVAVATDCRTGDPVYLERGKCSDMFTALKATASMPFISPMVEMDGRRFLDGGCSCNVPYQWALDQGYRKIVVIKTHDASYRNEDPREKNTARRVYRRHQELALALDRSDIRYKKEYDDLERLSAEGRIYVVQPSQVVTVGRVERNVEKLGELYWMGYNDAAACLEDLKSYLFS